MPGRPRSLDDSKRREVCAILSAGSSMRHAAQYVGCSVSTIRCEAARNEQFREQVRRAQANARLAPLQAMRQASHTHWRAAAWMLERSDPEQFGRRYRQSLGPPEFRALARDLIAIFDQEIDHPRLRDKISARIQAAIRYAMRHAWDTQRTGKQMRQAMDFFNQKDASPNPREAHDDLLPDWDHLIEDLPAEFCTTPPNPKSAKPSEYCAPTNQTNPSFPQPTQNPPPQNPPILQ